ncbi:carbohydrate esterase family 3 protein [Melanomma pulvis-pyrius CBS 109.77]|uniref:Carbohydrate esterase family 3 protein n=1 Tax=Melanomma pulvis-pyrius CBS 109.77 TaxID=1314802 RepID=A0A6A6WSM4_9PLEO|nr:carbohydrate esterase family 3 protein [Melanomma pulvis-pyrius CBS 109.77]
MASSTLGQGHAVSRRWNSWTGWTTLALLASNFWIQVSNAATPTTQYQRLQPRAPISNGVELRVLPIGDSITWGAQSTDETGYRKSLFNQLANRGNTVNFVGGTPSGQMADNDHEGHRGFIIDEISTASNVGIYAAANIVLLHAGTNDMKNDIDPSNAPQRLKNLINKIFEHSEDAVVFVCQIIPANPVPFILTVPRIARFNSAIPDLVDEFVSAGKKVMMVSMNNALLINDLADGLHPNDNGYLKMADAYYAAIEKADEKKWITKPGKGETPPTLTGPEFCKSTPSWYNVGQIANGAKIATSDGTFKPSWVKKGVIAEGACPRAQLHLMDLNGDGLKDYACVNPKTGAVKVHLSIPDSDGKPSGNWKELGTVVSPTDDRNGTGVMFADLNGDGRDDYIYVNPKNGDVSAWINRLEKDDVWQWQGLGKIAGGVGATNDTLQMVDIDGDGRADFCLVDKDTGEVTAWLNTGADVVPDYHKIGIIATGGTATEGDKVRLGDLTGEGRADYMIIGAGGKVVGLVNRLQETSMVPRWSEAIVFAEGPDGAKQDQVRLVDMTGDGKVDYLLVDEKTGKITLWESTGTGGKYQSGEGVVLCDLDGDGTSDYFWLDHTGGGWGYLNTGKGKNLWYDLGKIANGEHTREQVRMGVLTKTGRADYIVVDEDTGRASWWQNLGPDGNWGWSSRGVFAEGPSETIENKYGWKFKGRNVRFADLDGDGFDDYLYVNDQGATVMWRHLGTNPPTWGYPYLVADGVGVLAQDVQFADTNGDGRLDYVVVGRVTGSARSWHNLGFRDDRSIRWNTPLSFADGMTGDKRADYVSINPDDGRLNLWHNRCWLITQPSNPGGGIGGNDPVTTVIGGTTTEISGTTTVIGGTTTTIIPGGDDDPVTTVIGGTTTVISGTTTVIGGTTTTRIPGGATPTSNPFPIVTNGHCTGSDCDNGRCTGILCASFGCSGSDCSNGRCIGTDCIPSACIGRNCENGVCKGAGCSTGGCEGSDCEGGTGHCLGLHCISIGCIGPDCGSDGKCSGNNCSERSCSGSDCHSGTCAGSSCNNYGGEVGGGSDAPDDDKDPETCTTSKEYPTCTTKYIVYKTVYPEQDTSTISTSTTSSCYTVTACTGSATTVETTTTTTTTDHQYCDPTSCGNSCPVRRRERRVGPTGVPKLDSLAALENQFKPSNLTIQGRNLPRPGTGDWKDFYEKLEADDITHVVDNGEETMGTLNAIYQVAWQDYPQNFVVRDLSGCIVVIAVSHREQSMAQSMAVCLISRNEITLTQLLLGVFVAHYWQRRTIATPDQFEKDVVKLLRATFSSQLAPGYFTPDTSFFIMAGTTKTIDEDDEDALVSLRKSDDERGPQYPSQVAQIRTELLRYYPDASVETFIYLKQSQRIRDKNGAWGKVAILFDPNQNENPNNPNDPDWSKGYASWQVYLQAYKAGEQTWSYQKLSIWRVHRGDEAYNALLQVDKQQVPYPCSDTFEPFDSLVKNTQKVNQGSEITDVGTESVVGDEKIPPRPLILRDKSGKTIYTGCVFDDSGFGYEPTSKGGYVAGFFSCDNNVAIDCIRPEFNLATTCDDKPVSDCGPLGKGCSTYYQLLAECHL